MRYIAFLLFGWMGTPVHSQSPQVLTAEYFWDTDPGAGLATVMDASDGNFSSAFEQLIANATAPSAGVHKLFVRVKGSDGAWATTFTVIVDVVALRHVKVTQAEYFWDTDPGAGSGSPMLAFDGNFTNAFEQVNASATSPLVGMHKLGFRVKGSDGMWGPVFSTIVDVVALRHVNVIQAEYFWDTDPGLGNAIAMLAFDGNFNNAFEQSSASASTAGLSVGLHVLHVRSKGTDGAWGPAFRIVLQVDPQPDVVLSLDLRVALQGCMGNAALMNNTLRNAGLVPLSEPYSALGHDLGTNAGATTTSTVMNIVFPPGASVVDWILVELHPSVAPWQTTLSFPALLRRGGTVAGYSDGAYPFLISVPAGTYYVVVRHRNHLPIVTASPIALTTNGAMVAVNFTAAASNAFGSDAQVLTGSLWCMWSGDVNSDATLKYTGANNDRDPVLVSIGGTTPNNTAIGYRSEDLNMDGVVKYTGASNDRDPILVNIGGTTPNNVRSAQLP